MTEQFKAVAVDDHEYGRVVRIVDEYGIPAGFDPSPHEIGSVAKGLRLDLVQVMKLAHATRRIHEREVAIGGSELIRHFGSFAPGSRAEKAAIPHNYLALGDIALHESQAVQRTADKGEENE